jgi:crotonobetainyl-CoA:carnitine CoA-transferase CaiB-like acyl-CoA transferase
MQKDTDQMLDGVSVLDISNLIAGPGISTNLADFGANVIKVEHPKMGDYIRNWGHKKNGVPLAWKSHARGKRLLSVNLNTTEGQEIIRRLAADADILIESYRPGKLEEWGLDFDTLAARNPKLILVRVTGWGQTGPYKDRPGFGTLAEAISGFAHITGLADGPPTLPSFALGDGITSLVGTYAVMMALYHRDVHDTPGQVIDLSIFESIFSILGPQAIEFDQLGIVQQRFGNRSPRGVPRNAYETSDQRWLAISASASDMALRLFRAIGRDDMTSDPRYATPAKRLEHGDVVDGIIADWIKQRSLHEVLDRLEKYQVPAAPIYDIEQIQRDPHYQARQTITQLPDEDLNTINITNIPVKFSRTPGKIRHTGRTAIGYDTVEILQGIGMNDREIEDLINQQIIRVRKGSKGTSHG